MLSMDGPYVILQQNVIAVVDDDPDMRTAMEHVLSVLGYQTELFGSAEEFIHAAPTTQAACLIVDIQLGDISGVELKHHLAKTGFNFPVIFMTGSNDEIIQKQAINSGCVAYLRKPFRTRDLLDAVKKALQR